MTINGNGFIVRSVSDGLGLVGDEVDKVVDVEVDRENEV